MKAKVSAFNLLEEIGNAFIYADSRAKEGKLNSSEGISLMSDDTKVYFPQLLS